jgi:hypothetical protein
MVCVGGGHYRVMRLVVSTDLLGLWEAQQAAQWRNCHQYKYKAMG